MYDVEYLLSPPLRALYLHPPIQYIHVVYLQAHAQPLRHFSGVWWKKGTRERKGREGAGRQRFSGEISRYFLLLA